MPCKKAACCLFYRGALSRRAPVAAILMLACCIPTSFRTVSAAAAAAETEASGMTFWHEMSLEGGHCRDVLEASDAPGSTNILLRQLKACGIVRLRNAVSPDCVQEAHSAFLDFESREDFGHYAHEVLRERRTQHQLPFETPFSTLGVCVHKPIVRLLRAYLGPAFTLDLLTAVVVAPGADAQGMHRDTQSIGSIAVHLPAHPLTPRFAPLALCGGTHNLSDSDWNIARQGVVHSNTAETPRKAFQRALCKDLIIGAPASVGDAIVYDSKLFHWGAANEEALPRYAFYANYKNSSAHPGVHPDYNESSETQEALEQFRMSFAGVKAHQEDDEVHDEF